MLVKKHDNETTFRLIAFPHASTRGEDRLFKIEPTSAVDSQRVSCNTPIKSEIKENISSIMTWMGINYRFMAIMCRCLTWGDVWGKIVFCYMWAHKRVLFDFISIALDLTLVLAIFWCFVQQSMEWMWISILKSLDRHQALNSFRPRYKHNVSWIISSCSYGSSRITLSMQNYGNIIFTYKIISRRKAKEHFHRIIVGNSTALSGNICSIRVACSTTALI